MKLASADVFYYDFPSLELLDAKTTVQCGAPTRGSQSINSFAYFFFFTGGSYSKVDGVTVDGDGMRYLFGLVVLFEVFMHGSALCSWRWNSVLCRGESAGRPFFVRGLWCVQIWLNFRLSARSVGNVPFSSGQANDRVWQRSTGLSNLRLSTVGVGYFSIPYGKDACILYPPGILSTFSPARKFNDYFRSPGVRMTIGGQTLLNSRPMRPRIVVR